MNKQSENPMWPLSPELRAKFEKLLKPKWLEDQYKLKFDEEMATELWDEVITNFGQFNSEYDTIHGRWLFEKYPEFVNSLTTSEAFEIKHLLISGIDAERHATLAKITKALRLPSE